MTSVARPSIPTPLRRQVLVEAGHRCAIPTCRQHPVEVHHIRPWADVQEHSAENLIVLCPNCHARVTKGDIDRKSVEIYKANLGVLTARYTQIERRLLQHFIDDPHAKRAVFMSRRDFDFRDLIRDGVVEEDISQVSSTWISDDEPGGPELPADGPFYYRPTEKGRALIEGLVSGETIP